VHSDWDVAGAKINGETFVMVGVRSVVAVCYGCYDALCVVKFSVDGGYDGGGKYHLGSDAEYRYAGFEG